MRVLLGLLFSGVSLASAPIANDKQLDLLSCKLRYLEKIYLLDRQIEQQFKVNCKEWKALDEVRSCILFYIEERCNREIR